MIIIKNDWIKETISKEKDCDGFLQVYLFTTFLIIIGEVVFGILIALFLKRSIITGFEVGAIIGFLIGISCFGFFMKDSKMNSKKKK
ncbi:MAG: hypothetical protein QG630_503 [Patescibacteria group bacterium]|nr:hypothetical protein [Patescibacteria group bacterium]